MHELGTVPCIKVIESSCANELRLQIHAIVDIEQEKEAPPWTLVSHENTGLMNTASA